MPRHRLQKLISASGICSRRHAENLIAQNRVAINGKLAKVGDQADPNVDEVLVDGSRLVPNVKYKVLLINKPKGVISSCSDTHRRPTLLELLPTEIRKGIHPVGRLDIDSRGAILLTNHGELTLQLTHPRYSHKKTYHVWVKGLPSEKSLDLWRNGIMLDGNLTKKADVTLLSSNKQKSLLTITLKEGRNRQIRRIATLFGHEVIDLKRTSVSGITLKGLEEGKWRELAITEWSPLLNQRKLFY